MTDKRGIEMMPQQQVNTVARLNGPPLALRGERGVRMMIGPSPADDRLDQAALPQQQVPGLTATQHLAIRQLNKHGHV